MGLFDGLFGKGKRHRLEPSEEELANKAKERALISHYRVEALQGLARSRPDILAAMLFPRVGKLIVPPAEQRDPMHELAMEALRSKLTRDPLDDLLKMQQGARAMRELQAELAPEVDASAPTDGAAGIIRAVADSPFGEALGAVLGQAILNGRGAMPANPQLQAGSTSGQPAAAETPAGQPQQQPAVQSSEGDETAVGPISVLQAKLLVLRLKKLAPEEAAAQLVQLAQQRQDVNDFLVVVLETPDSDLEELLRELGQIQGWGEVATWLLENVEYTRALVAELHNLASVEPVEAPTPEAQ